MHEAIAVIRDEFGLDEPTLTMSKVGRKLYVEATFMVAPHSWDIDGEDAVRRSFATSLADLPYEPWLNIELTTESGADALATESALEQQNHDGRAHLTFSKKPLTRKYVRV